MRVGGRFRLANTRRERRSLWCDQSVTHPSQKAAKDGAPTVWFVIGRPDHPPNLGVGASHISFEKPDSDENRQNNAWVIRTILAWPPYQLTPENPGTLDWE